MTTTIETIRDGDERYRVVERYYRAERIATERTLGYVRRWRYRDGRTNDSGCVRFQASVLGRFEAADFETLSAAVSFVVDVARGA